MSGGPVSWRSTLQSTVILSMTEVEYMVVTKAFKGAIWLHSLIINLGMSQDHIRVFYDS